MKSAVGEGRKVSGRMAVSQGQCGRPVPYVSNDGSLPRWQVGSAVLAAGRPHEPPRLDVGEAERLWHGSRP